LPDANLVPGVFIPVIVKGSIDRNSFVETSRTEKRFIPAQFLFIHVWRAYCLATLHLSAATLDPYPLSTQQVGLQLAQLQFANASPGPDRLR